MQVSGGHKGGKRILFNEINITPLTDIFLVLLIIMMVVAPMMQSHHEGIKPPSLTSGDAIKQNLLTVEVTKDNTFFVNGKPVAETELQQSFEQAAPRLEEKIIMLRADKATKSGSIIKVMEAAKLAQFKKLTVAGENISEQRQDELGKLPVPVS
jgi:biopolymer transport protein ExbD